VNQRKGVSACGIPVSLADDLEMVADVVIQLQRALPALRITVRLHPRDERKLALPLGTKYQQSDASKEGILDFLLAQDVVIAGETGVHLEAALLNVPSVYFQLVSTPVAVPDVYGFLERGLMPAVGSSAELIDLLRGWEDGRPQVRDRAGYYAQNVLSVNSQGSAAAVRAAITALLSEQTKGKC
ncbi:MAG: hypothetical protein AAF597_14470, partial [Bacteroidota bacterium]